MVEAVPKGYVEQKYPRLSLSVLLAATSIFFSISAATAQESSDVGNENRQRIALDSPFSDSSPTSEQAQLSELLPSAFAELQAEFTANHPEATPGISIARYYHEQAGLGSGSLLSDHTYQKLVTLETFAALSGVLLPDPYYQTPRFRQREQNLYSAITQMRTVDGQSASHKPETLSELITLAARLSQLSEFGIYLKDFATVEENGRQLLLRTTQETQVASIGISFMARHFLSAVKRQQVYPDQPLSSPKWFMAMTDSFAYFEGLKAMNPYSGAQTDESYQHHLQNEVAHFVQFSPYTLHSIDATFQYEFERLLIENADPFPVGAAGQAVPYTFYTYPASDGHAQGFDPMNLPSNVLFGQKFEDGSAFIIYSSGESRANLSVHAKLALFQSRYLPSFEDWWSSLPRKANVALEVLPAARVDESNRLAAALMEIPFDRLVNYAAGDLSEDTEALFNSLLSDPELGFEEVVAGKQKLAFLLLLHRCNPAITHPVLQRDSSRYQFDLRAELFDPLAFQQEANTRYEQNAEEDEIPLVFLPLNKMRTMSTFQTLIDFGVVPPTYQHTNFELTPEILASQAEFLVTWLEDGSILLFQVDENQVTMSGIRINIDGDLGYITDQPLPNLLMENLFAVPGR